MKKIFTLFCLLFLPPSLMMAEPLPFPEDTIAYNDRFNNRQWVQFDQEGNLHITYTGQFGTASHTRDIYYVTDESGEFVTTQVTNTGVDNNYSSFVFDEDGTMHLVYIQRDASNNFQLVYRQKENGDFSEPVWITSGNNKASPHIAIGSDNFVHFVYISFVSGQPDYNYHITHDLNTGTTGTPTQLGTTATDPSGENDIRVVVDSDNHAHVVFREGGAWGGNLRYFNNSSGSMEEEATPVTETILYPAMTIDQDDKLHIIFRRASDNRIAYFTRDAEGFSVPVNATPPDIGNPAFYRTVDVDDEGRFYFTYQNSISGNPIGFFLVSGIDGVFEEPRLIWNDPEDLYLLRNTSSVAARGDGDVAAFYAPSASRDGDIVCDIFMKRGLLFADEEPIIEVSPISLNFGTVEVNESKEMNLTIYNQGPVELNIQDFQFSDDVFFSPIDGPTTIPPYGNLVLPVMFIPEEPVVYQETMTILSDAANDPEVEISLSGEGVVYEAIIDVTATLQFEDTQIDETSHAALNIQNSGNIDLEITGLDIAGDDPDFFDFDADLPLLVEAGEEMQLNLSFSPEEEREYFATLIITSNASNEAEAEVSLSGEGLNGTLVETPESLEEQLTLFPNPATDYITLQFNAEVPAQAKIRLVDAFGKTTMQWESQHLHAGNNEISIELNAGRVKPGIYFLTVTTADQQVVRKIVIQ